MKGVCSFLLRSQRTETSVGSHPSDGKLPKRGIKKQICPNQDRDGKRVQMSSGNAAGWGGRGYLERPRRRRPPVGTERPPSRAGRFLWKPTAGAWNKTAAIKDLAAPGSPNRSEFKDSLLPLLVSSPELVDYEGQTVREAHGGHTGEEEDEDEDETGGDREGDKTLLKRINTVRIGPNSGQESPTRSVGGQNGGQQPQHQSPDQEVG